MTGPVTGIRRRRGVAGRRATPHLPPDRDCYGQTLDKRAYIVWASALPTLDSIDQKNIRAHATTVR